MRIVYLAMFAFALSGMASDHAEPFKVGEKWVYKHDGPRPFSWNLDPVDGDWVRSVVSVKGEGDQKIWTIEERYGDSAGQGWNVDGDRHVQSLEVGDNIISYSPPGPYDFPLLGIGEEKKVELKMEGDWGSLPITSIYKREENETINVPAGEFKDSHHYKINSVIKFNRDGNEIELKTSQDMWYHPDVNGLIKRIFMNDSDGETDRSYKTISELKEYSAAEE